MKLNMNKMIKRIIGTLMILSVILFVGYQIVNEFGSYTWSEYLIGMGSMIIFVIVLFTFLITAMYLINPNDDKNI